MCSIATNRVQPNKCYTHGASVVSVNDHVTLCPHFSHRETRSQRLLSNLGHGQGLPGPGAQIRARRQRRRRGRRAQQQQKRRRDHPGGERNGRGQKRRAGGVEEEGRRQEAVPQEEDAHGFLPEPGVSAGVHLRHEALPEQLGAGLLGLQPAADGDSGQDVVSEQEEQMETAALS